MKNLIVVEGENKYEYDNYEELKKAILGSEYEKMSEEEKNKELQKRAIMNVWDQNVKITDLKSGVSAYSEKDFIIYDEFSFILSLLKFDRIVVLERTDADIFCKYMDKSWVTDNYIIVNKFANEIMKEYLNNR